MKRLMIGLLLATIAGCGGAAVPQDQVASSQAAIRAAEVGGAPANPQTALLLKKAKEQVEHAKALIKEDENHLAALALMRAEADAELALSLAQEQAMAAEALEARQEVEKLRQQNAPSEPNAKGNQQ